MFAEGQGREVDAKKAFGYYKKASEAGMAMGSSNVAKQYHFNDDEKKRDFEKAVYYYKLALEQSENDFSSAANNLADL